MSESNKNIVRVKVIVKGTRPLLQHAFGPEAISLEREEKKGVAGNVPDEWKKTMLVTGDGQLYIRNDYVFGALRDAAVHTKKGRGSIQKNVEATLQVDPAIILLDRRLPDAEPDRDPMKPVYLKLGIYEIGFFVSGRLLLRRD